MIVVREVNRSGNELVSSIAPTRRRGFLCGPGSREPAECVFVEPVGDGYLVTDDANVILSRYCRANDRIAPSVEYLLLSAFL
jgi:hypothetical protein